MSGAALGFVRALLIAGLALLFVLSVDWTRYQGAALFAALEGGRRELAADINWRTQVGLSVLWTLYAAGALAWGFLRSAPAVGALATSIFLARYPLRRRIGPALFRTVIVFGAATIVFGLSTNFTLSLVALAVLGASDVVSVVIRASLVQIRTPDTMRGRV